MKLHSSSSGLQKQAFQHHLFQPTLRNHVASFLLYSVAYNESWAHSDSRRRDIDLPLIGRSVKELGEKERRKKAMPGTLES